MANNAHQGKGGKKFELAEKKEGKREKMGRPVKQSAQVKEKGRTGRERGGGFGPAKTNWKKKEEEPEKDEKNYRKKNGKNSKEQL